MSEREMEIVPLFTRQDKVSIDVGAAHGEYTSRLVKTSRFVYAFEPLYELYRDALSPILLGNANVSILPCAVSNHCGRAVIRVPFFANRWQPYRASISQDFAGVQHQDYDVPIVSLDSLGIEDVGFIKIDVEGNELNVVTGALNIIRKDRPILLIEMEQRHIPSNLITIIEVIESLGYHSYIFRDGKIAERHTFDLIEIQRIGLERLDPEIYLNNVIFMPTARTAPNIGWITAYASDQDSMALIWQSFDSRHGKVGCTNWIIADHNEDPGAIRFNGKLQRAWSRNPFSPNAVVRAAENLNVGHVIINYDPGLFPPLHFDAMIKGLASHGIKITLIISTVSENTLNLLSIRLCSHLVLSSAEGLALAQSRGLASVASLLPTETAAAADHLRSLIP